MEPNKGTKIVVDKTPRLVGAKHGISGSTSGYNPIYAPILRRLRFLRHPNQFPKRQGYQINIVYILVPMLLGYHLFWKGDHGLLGGEMRIRENRRSREEWLSKHKGELDAVKAEMIQTGEWDRI